MKMSEFTTLCNPGRNWAACEAQRWNCPPEVIELKMDEAKRAETDTYFMVRRYVDALKALGLKQAAYCEFCGCKYDG